MLSTLATIALVLALVIAVVVAYAATRPATFHVARSLDIRGAPERLYPLINDLHVMNTWNPYALRDPTSQMRYSGPASGPGASFTFDGGKSGTGKIEIVEAHPPRDVTMRLSMAKPMRAQNTVRFTLEPKGDQTRVTWAMDGNNSLIGKIFSLFIDCDRMMGRDFEEGLGNLKAVAEKA